MRRCLCEFLRGHPKDGSTKKACTCTAPQIDKISSPLVDRIDIEVPRLSSGELMGKRADESSACVRKRVCAARSRQSARLADSGVSRNARMRSAQLKGHYEMDGATKDLLKTAIAQFSLSGRAYDRSLKVSRTIVGLEEHENIELYHVAEAINYWTFNRKLFV